MNDLLNTLRRPMRGTLAGTGLFLLGVLVGGVTALMLAPKSGKELRSDVERKIDTLLAQLRDLIPPSAEGSSKPPTEVTLVPEAGKDQAANVMLS